MFQILVYFLCKNCKLPWKKSVSSFQATPLLNFMSCQAPPPPPLQPFFQNWPGGSTPPAERGGADVHYATIYQLLNTLSEPQKKMFFTIWLVLTFLLSCRLPCLLPRRIFWQMFLGLVKWSWCTVPPEKIGRRYSLEKQMTFTFKLEKDWLEYFQAYFIAYYIVWSDETNEILGELNR